MNDSAWTIKRLLDWTAEYFSERDDGESRAGQPRLEAEVLLAEALGCERIELYTRFDEVVEDEPKTRFRNWVKRRADGEPVAYLVGHREFFSLEFEVNSSVLIPRPETEHLVTSTLDIIKTRFADQPVRVVDVGTGSGCIAISIAKQCANATILAIDISDQALEVARKNVSRHEVENQVHLEQGNLLATVEDLSSYQIIISNPPYIGQSERENVSKDVRDFEPETALFSNDQQGTAVSFELVDQVSELPPGTILLLESSPMNIEAIADRIRAKGFAECEIKKDYAGLLRWIEARR